jgi:hypothetical protein
VSESVVEGLKQALATRMDIVEATTEEDEKVLNSCAGLSEMDKKVLNRFV